MIDLQVDRGGYATASLIVHKTNYLFPGVRSYSAEWNGERNSRRAGSGLPDDDDGLLP